MTNRLTTGLKRRIHQLDLGPNGEICKPICLFDSKEEAGGMNKSGTAQCARAVSLFGGLYARVARDLSVDVSYISRIARGERKSKVAEKALAKEFNKVVAVMRTGLAWSAKKLYIVVTLECPRCKTQQKVHIAAGPGLRQTGGERISCINCDHHFKATIPDRIIRGPFPA
jgi:hypothetical protein